MFYARSRHADSASLLKTVAAIVAALDNYPRVAPPPPVGLPCVAAGCTPTDAFPSTTSTRFARRASTGPDRRSCLLEIG